LTALLVAGVLVLIRRGGRVEKLIRANVPIVLFLLYCGMSIVWSDFSDVAFKRWIKALSEFVMVAIILTDEDALAALKRVFAWLAFVLFPVSILFIKYYPDLGRGYRQWVWTPYYTGVTQDKNALGMICMVFGLASVWRVSQELRAGKTFRTSRPLIAHCIVLATVLWLLSKAGSMTSLSCFLLGTGLIVATSSPSLVRKPAAIHLLVGLFVAAAFSVLFLGVDPGVLEAMGKNSTLTGRTDIWALVLHLTVNPLFGAGFESFWLGPRLEKIWEVYWFHPTEAHNGYLDVYLNLGWVGVALLAGIIVTGYRNVIGMFRRDPDAGRLKLAYFVAAITYNFTESAFKTMHLVWIAFLLAVIVTPAARLRKNGRASRDTSASEAPLCREEVQSVSLQAIGEDVCALNRTVAPMTQSTLWK
jgi:O-antigen ligase